MTPNSAVPPAGTRIVILAQSGRLLAQSAVRAGWRPWVLDLYGDVDTGASSERCVVVADRDGVFDENRVASVLSDAIAAGAAGLVYGSGLEGRWTWLARWEERLPLWGNTPETLRQVKSPRSFFALLSDLGVRLPETRFTRPENLSGWLRKPACGEGGKRVAFLADSHGLASEWADVYYQRHVAGTPMSALFLADGSSASLIGFNRLRTVGSGTWPFLFAGAWGPCVLPESPRRTLLGWLGALVPAVGLRGLNSLDFVFDGKNCWVLELNARPTATQALYEGGFAGGLLRAHVAACLGDRLAAGVVPAGVRGSRVIYAAVSGGAPALEQWPAGCADLPVPGTRLVPGQPVCTVYGEGHDEVALERLLDERERLVAELLRWRTT